MRQNPNTIEHPDRHNGCQEAGEPTHAVDRTNETSSRSGFTDSLLGQAQVAGPDNQIIHGGENRQGITSRIIG